MEEYLCVIRQDENVDWYMLCVRDSYFVIACGTKETIIQSIKTIRKRYRSKYGLHEALMNMSEPARCNPFTRQAYEALYRSQKGKYDYLLRDTLEGEYEKIREKRKVKKPVLVKRDKARSTTKHTSVIPSTPPKAKVGKPIVLGRTKKARKLDME